MRFFVLIVCLMMVAIGCKKNKPAAVTVQKIPKQFQVKNADVKSSSSATQKPAQPKPDAAKSSKTPKAPLNQPVITPDETPFGTVVLVNGSARFAVVNFSFGTIPPAGRRIFAYREGLKVAELKVTGPQREDNTVADIVTGEVKVKDEVKVE